MHVITAYFKSGKINAIILYPVDQTLDSAIQRIKQLFPVILICWMGIYPVDSAMQLLNNLGLVILFDNLIDGMIIAVVIATEKQFQIKGVFLSTNPKTDF